MTHELTYKQVKEIDRVIRKHGGSAKINALPIDEKLMVKVELDVVRQTIGKKAAMDEVRAAYNLMNAFNTPAEKEKIANGFEKEIKLLEKAANALSVYSEIRRSVLKSYAGFTAGAIGLTTTLAGLYEGRNSTLGLGIAAVAIGLLFMRMGNRSSEAAYEELNRRLNEEERDSI